MLLRCCLSPPLRPLAGILLFCCDFVKNKLKCKTLVVGFEGGGASFAQKCFGLASDDGGGGGCSTDWIGTVVLPGAPSGTASTSGVGLGDSFDPADPLNSACNIFLKRAKGRGKASTHGGSGHDRSCNGDSLSNGNGDGDGAAAAEGSEEPESSTPTDGGAGGGNANNSDEERDGGDGVAVVLCGCRVPPSQADAWAKALLSGIDAEVVVALTAVAVEPGRSEAWQGARLIATAEAEEREDCLKVTATLVILGPVLLKKLYFRAITHSAYHTTAVSYRRDGRIRL